MEGERWAKERRGRSAREGKENAGAREEEGYPGTIEKESKRVKEDNSIYDSRKLIAELRNTLQNEGLRLTR